MNVDIKNEFFFQTGIKAVRVSQIGIGLYMIEAADGCTYKMHCDLD